MDISSLTHWHWWVLGIALIVLEVFAPGAIFIWMGVAAAVVGVILLVAPELGWEYQFMVFSILSIVAIAGWKIYQRKHPTETDRPTLNRRGEQYVGRTFTLDEPIVNGLGKIRVDDSTWKIEGKDCPAGTQIKVTGVEGTILMVEKAV
jgi:membrane protein implicated in regulation of membrane protease activity